jgi:hypothetical protein
MQSGKILLAVTLLLFSLLPLYAQYDSENDFRVELSEDKKSVLIIKYLEHKQNISIPPKIKGLPVSGIGDRAFSDRDFTSITIPNSVTSIGDGAFQDCIKLTSITIPDSVTSIGGYSFGYCISLTSVTIGKNVTRIEHSAFLDCRSLTAINADVNNKTYSSQDGVLYNRNKTVLIMYPVGKKGSFLIPNNVQSIGDHAFYECKRLTSVTIPDSVKRIGDYAFYKCEELTSIIIGNNVTVIGEYAFYKCEELTSVTIPDSITEIRESAFAHSGLISVTIPKNVTIALGFPDCASLTAINVDVDNTEYSSQDGVLYDKNKTNLYQYPAGKKGSFVIPDSVLSIGSCAFSGCVYLTAVTIGNNVTVIDDGAFDGCIELKKVIIPNKVKTVGWYAFHFCFNLTTVIIGNSVTEIGECAFFDCSSLTKITIPKSVTEIGEEAFYACESLVSVKFEGKIPSDKFDAKAFHGDLRDKFYATDTANGTAGTYTTTDPVDKNSVWTKR